MLPTIYLLAMLVSEQAEEDSATHYVVTDNDTQDQTPPADAAWESAAEALLSKLPDGVTEASLSGHSYAPSLVHAGEEVCKRCQVVIAVGDSQAGVCGGVR